MVSATEAHSADDIAGIVVTTGAYGVEDGAKIVKPRP